MTVTELIVASGVTTVVLGAVLGVFPWLIQGGGHWLLVVLAGVVGLIASLLLPCFVLGAYAVRDTARKARAREAAATAADDTADTTADDDTADTADTRAGGSGDT